jgi:hypothetical protein
VTPSSIGDGKSGAIRSSGRSLPGTILVVSASPDVREGWATYFEAQGHSVLRCAGPEATHCALELGGAHCPLQEQADVAWYDNSCVTEDLAADLTRRPRLLPVFFANDRLTADGHHQPEMTRAI